MNEIVKVKEKEVVVLEWRGQRVVTTTQLADIYESTETQIKQNYGNNEKRFNEGEHFYFLKGEELKEFKRLVENFDLPFMGNLKYTSQLYLWTRRGASRHCKMLGTEEAWEQFDALEENYYNPKKLSSENAIDQILENPDFGIKLLTAYKKEKERNEALQIEVAEQQKQIEEMQPKALFADAVSTSKTSILIGELAKILKQNGIETGQNRLFEWLRQEEYLIKRKGSDYNMPTQKSMELELFEVKESTINNPDGSVRINRTTKVTGKGQQYFVNKFLQKAS